MYSSKWNTRGPQTGKFFRYMQQGTAWLPSLSDTGAYLVKITKANRHPTSVAINMSPKHISATTYGLFLLSTTSYSWHDTRSFIYLKSLIVIYRKIT